MPKQSSKLTSDSAADSSTSASPTTITAKLAQLNTEIEWFYGEDFSLDQAAAKYQSTLALAKQIESDLGALKNHIEVIAKDFTKD